MSKYNLKSECRLHSLFPIEEIDQSHAYFDVYSGVRNSLQNIFTPLHRQLCNSLHESDLSL